MEAEEECVGSHAEFVNALETFSFDHSSDIGRSPSPQGSASASAAKPSKSVLAGLSLKQWFTLAVATFGLSYILVAVSLTSTLSAVATWWGLASQTHQQTASAVSRAFSHSMHASKRHMMPAAPPTALRRSMHALKHLLLQTWLQFRLNIHAPKHQLMQAFLWLRLRPEPLFALFIGSSSKASSIGPNLISSMCASTSDVRARRFCPNFIISLCASLAAVHNALLARMPTASRGDLITAALAVADLLVKRQHLRPSQQ